MEGRHIVPPGGWCLALAEMSANQPPQNFAMFRSDINWLVRVDWSQHGQGTYTKPHEVNLYVDRAIRYILGCQGVYGFIVGNEPNHENEGAFDPHYAAAVFSLVRNAVKSQNSRVRLITPGLAPYHRSDVVSYGKAMHSEIARLGGADGVALHAYTRTANPVDISSTETMAAPLLGQFRGFLTYRDQLSTVAASYQKTPAFITEFDELDGWKDENVGIFPAAVAEVRRWNREASHQQIHSLIAYRWPNYDRWGIEGKAGVVADFRSAIAGAEGSEPYVEEIRMPVVIAPPTPAPFQRHIEQDAVDYGVQVVPADTSGLGDGDVVWIAERVGRLNAEESEGRHHFYFDVVSENGGRIVDQPIYVDWGSGNTTVYTEEKPGEPWSANHAFTPGKNAWSAFIPSGGASDWVRGAGMGEDTPSGFNPGIHTCITVKWVKRAYRKGLTVKPTIKLSPPLANWGAQTISQRFGENPADYARFGLRGHTGIDVAVPLNTPVLATDEGVVQEAGELDDYGVYVKLAHSWGESVYAHLTSFRVRHGDHVGRGEQIGLSGNTGNSTGPHLHFAIRITPYNRGDGWSGYSDPMPYLVSTPVEPPLRPGDQEVLAAIKQAADEIGLDWRLLASLAWAESSFDPAEEGGGLMQIGNATWYDWSPRVGADNIWDARDNAKVGGAYLQFLMKRYDNIYKALWAYNAGPGNVDAGNVPAITKEYANKVVHGRDLLRAVGV